MFSFGSLVAGLLFFRCLDVVVVEGKSVIVDDADPAIQYSTGGWNVGNTCTGCFAQPDKSKASGGTWHDGTESGDDQLFFTFTFTGTSVEARYIAMDIIQKDFQFTTGTNVTYSVDGVQRGSTRHDPKDNKAYVYDQSLFKVDGLTNVEHTLRVELLKPSALLLDYLIYNEEDAATTTSASKTRSNTQSSTTGSSPSIETTVPPLEDNNSNGKSNMGPIIGGVVGGLFVLILVAVLLWYFLKRRRQSAKRHSQPILGVDAYPSPPAGSVGPGGGGQYLPPNARPDQPRMSMAPTQGGLSSAFYAPTEVGSQVSYSNTHSTPSEAMYGHQHSLLSAQHSASGVPTSNSSDAASMIGRNLLRAPSTSAASSSIGPSSPATTNFSVLPPIPEPSPAVNEKAVLARHYSVQNENPNPNPPPNSFYTNVVANRAQARYPDEPVEEGLMSRHNSVKSIPPPYSPGAVWHHDEDAPPMPSRGL